MKLTIKHPPAKPIKPPEPELEFELRQVCREVHLYANGKYILAITPDLTILCTADTIEARLRIAAGVSQ